MKRAKRTARLVAPAAVPTQHVTTLKQVPLVEEKVCNALPCLTTVIRRGATLGLLFGAGSAGTLGLAVGAAGGAAFGTFLAPLTFGFSAPVCAGFSALFGLMVGLVLGSGGGAICGAFLGASLFALGIWEGQMEPRSSHFVQAAAVLLLTGIAGPFAAAVGSFLGMLSGAFLGFFAGLFFAPFTFGISVPLAVVICAVLGAAIDAATGALLAAGVSALLVRYHGWLLAGFRRIYFGTLTALTRLRLQVATFIAPRADLSKAYTLETEEDAPDTAPCTEMPRRGVRRRRNAARM
mmetsp:Transcript_62894/g.140208  ORF Transcript_62894/g.140208 Transcript_62894/m.140208 type:complete len:293 (+) Transcript_62894:30-908(+)